MKGSAVTLPLSSMTDVLPVALVPPDPKSCDPATVGVAGGGAEELVVVVVVVVVVGAVLEDVLEEITPPVPVLEPPDPVHGFHVVTTQSPLEEEPELVVVVLLDVVALEAVEVVPVTLIKQSDPDAPALRHAVGSPMIIRYSAA